MRFGQKRFTAASADKAPIAFSRRRVLQGGLLGAAALTWPGLFFNIPGARAQSAFPIAIGDKTLTTVSDGHLMLPLDLVLPDVPRDDYEPLLEEAGLSADGLEPDCNVSVLETPNGLVVFDVGSGANFMPSAGRFLENFEAAGFAIDDVTDVIFTHAHPDHLWGLLDDFDELIFPNAAYRISRREFDYWTASDTMEKTPEALQSFVVGAQSRLGMLAEQFEFFEPGDEVVDGVEAMDTGGHTPGHTSFVLHGGDDPVMVLGDALSNHVISVERPEWHTGTDQDPEEGARTRQIMLDRLAGENMRFVGFHMPTPGAGRIERNGNGYRFVSEG